MKSSSRGMSLSMRMRIEGSKKLKKQTQPDGLQEVVISRPPLVDPDPDSPVNKFLLSAERTVKEDNLFARLAGSASNTNMTAGPFVERGRTVRPLALCVRCSERASICMVCCDYQAQNAVAYYRRSLGYGASSILNQAIKEAGLATTVKSFIFCLWKNSIKKWLKDEKRMNVEVGFKYGLKRIKTPFVAWKKFTKDSIIEKKNNQIKELKEKMKAMEHHFTVLEEEKNSALQQMVTIRDRFNQANAVAEGYIAKIKSLEKVIAVEQHRVKALCALTAPVLELTNLCDQHAINECRDFESAIIDTGKGLPSFDYSPVFAQPTRDTITRLMKKRDDRRNDHTTAGKIMSDDFVVESTEAVKMMIQWLNYTSRSLSAIEKKAPDGEPYETMLPRHEQVFDLSNLRTGKTLSRIVFALIYFGVEVTRNKDQQAPAPELMLGSLGLASKSQRGSLGSMPSLSILNSPAQLLKVPKYYNLTDAQIAALKDNEDEAEHLIELSLRYATDFLGIPPFLPEDIVSGKTSTIFALVGCLMFGTNPPKTDAEATEMTYLLSEQTRLNTDLNALKNRLDYNTKTLIDVRDAWAHAMGIHLPSANDKDGGQDGKDGEGGEAENPTEEINKNVDEAEGETGGAEVTEMSGKESVQSIIPMKIPEDTPEEKYAKLAAAVDLLVKSHEAEMLDEALIDMTVNLERLDNMRMQLNAIRRKRDMGMRIATDVRNFVVNNWARNMFLPLEIIQTK